MDNKVERGSTPIGMSIDQKRANSFKKDTGKKKGIILLGILFISVLSSCAQQSFHENIPPVIIHFDSREPAVAFEPIQITDQFITDSGETWYVSHYFLLFSEDALYKGDVEGVTLLGSPQSEDVVAAYWQYAWLVIKRYRKEEIQDGLHVYLECGTHTFLPEPGTATETVNGMPLGLEETTILSILKTLGYNVLFGPTDGKIVAENIDWRSYPLVRGISEMESWLDEEGVSGAPRTLRLEPLRRFSNPPNYSPLLIPSNKVIDVRSTLVGTHEFTPSYLTYISEGTAFAQEKPWLTFQYALKTREAEPGERTTDLGASESASLLYFLTGLTLPDETFWVNLTPEEPERITDSRLKTNVIGKTMLEADLQMKRDFCTYENPCESEVGQQYWDLLNKKREELVRKCMEEHPGEIKSVSNVSFVVATRHWIVPDKITAYGDEDELFIVEATLKIFSEPVYEYSTFEITGQPPSISGGCRAYLDEAAKEYGKYAMELEEDLILPLVAREVNTGDRYTELRQVYASVVLAQWYKSSCDQCLFSGIIDTEQMENVASWEPWSPTTIWKEYVDSYTNGEYSCRIEETGENYIITRIYRGGGVSFTETLPVLLILGPTESSPGLQDALEKVPSEPLPKRDNSRFPGNRVMVGREEDEKESGNSYYRTILPVFFKDVEEKEEQVVASAGMLLYFSTVMVCWLHYGHLNQKIP